MRFRLRTKLEAGLAIGIVTLFVLMYIPSATRTISDSSDTIFTKITTSAGGVYDATWANLKTAVESLTNGGTVKIPVCNLTITSTLWVNHSGITIQGSGKAMRISSLYTKNATIFWIGANLPNGVIKIGGTTAPWKFYFCDTFEDFTIAGNHARSYTAVGINLTNADSPIVRDITFIGVKGTAIWCNNVRAPRIEDCDFGNCGLISGSRAYIYFMGDFDTTTVPIVTGCIFEPGFYCFINSSQTSPGKGYGSSNGKIISNYFEGNSSILYAVIPTQFMIIQNNCFLNDCNVSYIYSPTYFGRWLLINGNTFSEGASGGITEDYAQISLAACYDNKILNNFFYSSVRNGIYLNANCKNNTISDNIFDNMGGRGIYSWAENTLISDNIFKSIPTGFASDYYAIHLRAGANNNSIEDNKFIGCERGIYLATTTCNTTITGNTFYKIVDGSSYIIYGVNADDFITNNPGCDIFMWPARTTIPLSPIEGQYYVNSTSHHLYCYLNAVWVQLD
jgi:parallel beta-helix repeat protein